MNVQRIPLNYVDSIVFIQQLNLVSRHIYLVVLHINIILTSM